VAGPSGCEPPVPVEVFRDVPEPTAAGRSEVAAAADSATKRLPRSGSLWLGGRSAPEPASSPSSARAGGPYAGKPAGAEGSSQSPCGAGRVLPCSSPITSLGKRRRLRGSQSGLSSPGAPAAGPPPGGGRERSHTTTDQGLPRCRCDFALERRPILRSRPAVACRRREAGPTPGRIQTTDMQNACLVVSQLKLTHYRLPELLDRPDSRL